MNEPEQSNYSFAPIIEAFKRAFNLKPKDNESLID